MVVETSSHGETRDFWHYDYQRIWNFYLQSYAKVQIHNGERKLLFVTFYERSLKYLKFISIC